MAELVVLTGGAYSGKTALARELAARGCTVLPEAAYQVITELVDLYGVDEQARWREANQVEFQRRISERQHARETAARCWDARHVFCDRGLLDGLVYCRLNGVEWPADLHELAAPARYAHVFVLATLAGFDPRRETGRVDAPEDSLRAADLLEQVYRPRAAAVTRVPQLPVAARAELVLSALV